MKTYVGILAITLVAASAFAQGINPSATDTAGNAIIFGNDSVTSLSDVSDAGSGSIISSAERTKLGTIAEGATSNDQANITGLVTVHSDVSDAGSGAIITSAERTKLGTIAEGATSNDAANITGLVTVHSDVSDAGSGAIITTGERTIVGKAVTNDASITAQLSGEPGADSGKHLVNDGDGTVSWSAIPAGVSVKSGQVTCSAATNAVSFTTPWDSGSTVIVSVDINDQPSLQVATFAYGITTNGFNVSIDNGTTAYDATGLVVGWTAVVASNP